MLNTGLFGWQLGDAKHRAAGGWEDGKKHHKDTFVRHLFGQKAGSNKLQVCFVAGSQVA